MRRITSIELLDDDRGTPEEIARSLDDLWRINRWLGGVSGCLRLLEHFFAQAGAHPVRILDVGAGDARLAAFLERKLDSRGVHADFAVLDRRVSHLKQGHPFGTRLFRVAGDALRLPFRPGSFEVVMCNLFLHHFSGDRAEELLRSLALVAKKAVLINDLRRHALPYWFIRCAGPFARSRITRHDGPASVRQAYSRKEMSGMVRSAGFRNFEILRLRTYRLGLILWK